MTDKMTVKKLKCIRLRTRITVICRVCRTLLQALQTAAQASKALQILTELMTLLVIVSSCKKAAPIKLCQDADLNVIEMCKMTVKVI